MKKETQSFVDYNVKRGSTTPLLARAAASGAWMLSVRATVLLLLEPMDGGPILPTPETCVSKGKNRDCETEVRRVSGRKLLKFFIVPLSTEASSQDTKLIDGCTSGWGSTNHFVSLPGLKLRVVVLQSWATEFTSIKRHVPQIDIICKPNFPVYF